MVAVAAAGPLELVAVPTSTSSLGCEMWETIAARLDAAPEFWVERPLRSRQMDMVREGPEVVLRVLRHETRFDQPVNLEAPLDAATRALEVMFGVQHDTRLDLAPSETAWRLACAGDVAAWDVIGSALTPALFQTPIPPPPGDALIQRWAAALILRRQTRPQISRLSELTEALHDGLHFPAWRIPEPRMHATVAGTGREAVTLFVDGLFETLDVASGQPVSVWRADHQVEVEPSLVTVDGLDLIIQANGIRVHEPTSMGPDLAVELNAPFPEVALDPPRLFAADAATLVAVEPETGQVHWRRSLSVAPVAGPVFTGTAVLVPEEDAVAAFDPNSGSFLRRIPLQDDLSAPLVASASGPVWAFTGAQTVHVLSSDASHVDARFPEMGSVLWPPKVVGAQLAFLSTVASGRTELWILREDRAAVRLDRAAGPPLEWVEEKGWLIYHSRNRLVARNLNGEIQWSLSMPKRGHALSIHRRYGLLAVAEDVLWLDVFAGESVARTRLTSRARAVVAAETGGFAITETDHLVGIAAPDASEPMARFVALELAESSLRVGAVTRARRLAQHVLDRSPGDLRARAVIARSRRADLASWLPVLELAPRDSALRAEALDVVSALGVVGHGWTETSSLAEWFTGRSPPEDVDTAPLIGPPASPSSFGVYIWNGAKMELRNGAWWLVRDGRRPQRLLSRPEATPLVVDGGFALVDGRRVFGVDARRGRLRGPVLFTSTPSKVLAQGPAVVGQTAEGRLESVSPILLRRSEPIALPVGIDDWLVRDGQIALRTQNDQILILEP